MKTNAWVITLVIKMHSVIIPLAVTTARVNQVTLEMDHFVTVRWFPEFAHPTLILLVTGGSRHT